MQFPEARKVVQAWAEAVRDARDRSVRRVHVAACAVCSGAICGRCIHELGDEHVPGLAPSMSFLGCELQQSAATAPPMAKIVTAPSGALIPTTPMRWNPLNN